MDIYRRTQKATSQQKMNPNKGVVISNNALGSIGTNRMWFITYGPDGTTYSTPMAFAEARETFLLPIRMWGVCFDGASASAFGVS
jgi:hypothetical protein